MADRKFQRKKRDEVRRHRKPVMVIAAEGNNKTEKLYFQSFQSQHGKYNIKFARTGKDTDPEGIYKSVERYWKENDLSVKDKAYIVLDLDCSVQKAKKIEELERKSKNIRFIISNPCIEVWFLMHFVYSTRQFLDSKEPKREMRKYIEGYQENSDIATILEPRLPQAMEHIEKLKIYYKENGAKWISTECNPMTDVSEVVKEIKGDSKQDNCQV